VRIRELPSKWREHLTEAYFGNALFHTEVGGRASGRRIALHEFPKRNENYSEDMGRRAPRITCQGYIIVSPMETDYIPARDALIAELEADGPAYLKLPTMEPELCMCDQYRCDETRERGGIAVFDMVFVRRGVPPVMDVYDATQEQLSQSGNQMSQATQSWINTSMSGRGLMSNNAINAFNIGRLLK
jgi:hypothetical protein